MSKTNEPSLSDLISFMDDPVTAAIPDDPITEPEPNPEPEPDDDTPPAEPEPGPEPEKDPEPEPESDPEPTPPISTPTEEEEEEEPAGDLGTIYQIMAEENLLDVGEDFEFDGTPEKLSEALDKTFDSMANAARDSLLSEFSEADQLVIRQALARGGSLKDIVDEFYATPASLSEVDLSTEDNQREVVRQYLKQTTRYSDAKIDRQIDILEQSGNLQKEASDNLVELLDMQEQQREERATQVAQLEQQRMEQEDERRRLVVETIDSSDFVPSTRKKSLQAFMLNTSKRRGQQHASTEFARTLQTAVQNPDHLVQLADFLMEYDPEKGFNLERIARKSKTSAASKLRDKIDKAYSPTSKVKGSYKKGRAKQFDFQSWARQTD